MKKGVKVVFSVVLGVVAIMGLLFVIQKDMHIEAEVEIAKEPKEVFAYIKDLKNQDNFSVWMQIDPDMLKSYEGEDGTVGFISRWESNMNNVGVGEQEITAIRENEYIDYELRFVEPFESVSQARMYVEPDEDGTEVKWTFDGQEIFKGGIRAMATASDEVITKSGLTKEDIDLLIPHQANLRIVEGLEKMLSLPNATTIKKVHKYGNTSAASIPTALVDALEEGEIKGGEVAIFTAVGAGLSWGACALRLGERTTPINTSDAKLPDFDGKAVDTIRRAIEYQIPEKLDLI